MKSRQAIRTFCENCGGERKGAACTDPTCPLHPYRPGQKPGGSGKKGIRAFCLWCMGYEGKVTGEIRDLIYNCPSRQGCPLHPFRPYKEKKA